MSEILVELELDGQRSEDGVVDQGRTQVSQGSGRVLAAVLVQVPATPFHQ